MSGIAGLFRLDGAPAARDDIWRMTECLAHRGPDGSGIWNEHSVALGHRMLHTTPDSLHDEMPRTNGRSRLVLTADARIDNRDELVHRLGVAADVRASISDSELILHSYEKWGVQCVQALVGDFAFAIWDGVTQKLFCARDHLGVKPFYYFHLPGKLFAFGSEIKALFALAEVPRRLNETKIGDFFEWVGEDREITFYDQIHRLPAASCLTVDRVRVALRKYWSLDAERELRFRRDDQYSDAFREIFDEAVRCRMRACGPLGSTLSGGLDSTAVAFVARDRLHDTNGGPLPVFSLRFPATPAADEGTFIQAALAEGGFSPWFIDANAVGPVSALTPHLAHLDEPPFAATTAFHVALFAEARSRGVRVMLDGMFGDTAISHSRGYLPELARTLKLFALTRSIVQHARVCGESPWWILKRRALRPLATPQQLRLWQRAFRRPVAPAAPKSALRPDLVRKLKLQERHRRLRQHFRVARSTDRAIHLADLTSGTYQLGFELLDAVAALFQVDVRFPFTDRRLVEFCLALPAEQKFHRGWPRSVLRLAMSGSLPDAVRWRTGKADLSPWFVRGIEVIERQRVEGLANGGADSIANFVDRSALCEIQDRFTRQGDLPSANRLWEPLVFSSWSTSREDFFTAGPITKGGDLTPRSAVPTPAGSRSSV